MKKVSVVVLAAVVAALSLAAGAATAPSQTTSLTIYSGREERLVKPIMDRFVRETGIELQVRYASSTSLATALVEEGNNSPADVYWSQEPGTLGLVGRTRASGATPPGDGRQGAGAILDAAAGAGSARADAPASSSTTRTSYSRAISRTSVWGLTAARWKGRIGIAPTNASFQAFLGAAIHLSGEARVRAWLRGLEENDVRFYPNNTHGGPGSRPR